MRPLQDADQVIEFPTFPIHLFKIPPILIQEVILGCRMKDDIKGEIIRTLKYSPHFQHVRVIQTKLNDMEFKLMFHDITI